MTGLPDGRKSFKIGLAVLIQYRRVTSSQPRRRSKYALCISESRSKDESAFRETSTNYAETLDGAPERVELSMRLCALQLDTRWRRI